LLGRLVGDDADVGSVVLESLHQHGCVKPPRAFRSSLEVLLLAFGSLLHTLTLYCHCLLRERAIDALQPPHARWSRQLLPSVWLALLQLRPDRFQQLGVAGGVTDQRRYVPACGELVQSHHADEPTFFVAVKLDTPIDIVVAYCFE